jgi:hypothetical protein
LQQQSKLWRSKLDFKNCLTYGGWLTAIEFSARLIVVCLFCRVSAALSMMSLDCPFGHQRFTNRRHDQRETRSTYKRNGATNLAAKKDVK